PNILDDIRFITLPNELALVTAISPNPSFYFSNLMVNFISNKLSSRNVNDFTVEYFSRLVLERPDFKSDFLINISILYLYSKSKLHTFRSNFQSSTLIDIYSKYATTESTSWNIKPLDEVPKAILNDYSLEIVYNLPKNEIYENFINIASHEDYRIFQINNNFDNMSGFFDFPQYYIVHKDFQIISTLKK
ncbi:MAG: hypothetical protein AB8G86_00750, partial [Saprospiraceae bacterium]